MNDTDDREFYFYHSEREFLLNRIDSDVEETRRIERLVILAAAAVYTWLATESGDAQVEALAWAWWIPLGVTVLGVIRCLAVLKRINVVASYVKLIEDRYATIDDVPGWRTYFDRHGRGKVTRAVLLSWLILLITTTLVPILVSKT
jgi:hypothetical protein